MALLARWFRFQPSEIDELEIEDFAAWTKRAALQIRSERDAAGG